MDRPVKTTIEKAIFNDIDVMLGKKGQSWADFIRKLILIEYFKLMCRGDV